MNTKSPLQVIGHRGLPATRPENTLIGLLAALEAGADGVEFDVQFTKEGIPVVLHDAVSKRVASGEIDIARSTLTDLSQVSVHEPARFDKQFFPMPIATLREVCAVLSRWQRHVFIEVKSESIIRWGLEKTARIIERASHELQQQRIVISYDADFIATYRQLFPGRVGWVLTRYNSESQSLANTLKPDYLICNVKKLDGQRRLWQGNWQWFFYDIIDRETALHCLSLGASLVESWNCRQLLLELNGQHH